MAGRGPAPKGTRSRPSDQRRDEAALTVIDPDDEVRGPELPDSFDWPAETRHWWETWRRAAQAQTFTDTDWSFLLDTAVMHAEFWMGNRALAPELRLRVAKFGATPEDRARLRMSVGEPKRKTATKLQPKGAEDRRARLLRAVGDDGNR
jgi:hypothetical protein